VDAGRCGVMHRGPRDRHDDWALTALFALLPALVLAISTLTSSGPDLGDVLLGSYFALLSLGLYAQSVRVRRQPSKLLRLAWVWAVSALVLAAGVALIVADAATHGRV